MENKKKSYAELLFDDLESLYGEDEPCSAPCPNCKHYNSDHPNICTAFPEGIPALILAGQHNHRAPFPGDNGIQWTDSLTKKERKEAVLLLSDNKAGAIYRIALALEDGKAPDPRDVELLSNKQGRPTKDALEAAFEEADIMEDYGELRAHGVKYDIACEIVAHLHNFGTKHIKAIVTSWNNHAKDCCTEEEWRVFKEKQKNYLKDCRSFWGRKIFKDE